MENWRGKQEDISGSELEMEPLDREEAGDPPPVAIGQNERRMQVRAYNLWASLLQNRNFPSIEDLEPAAEPDFSPYSVLLDFSTGIDNPSIAYLGEALAAECGGSSQQLRTLADVPGRSLLSRITDHYLQILANQAPIGFEAEFANQQGLTVLYRGILLPFSSDDDTIDFIYGVINWKELADPQAADELLLEIDQALEEGTDVSTDRLSRSALSAWADGPGSASFTAVPASQDESVGIPRPSFGLDINAAGSTTPQRSEFRQPAPPAPQSLADILAAARSSAEIAQACDDRTRQALYAAIAQAYDFSLAAGEDPHGFSELLADSGVAVQERAPMTPVIKLIFGTDYDKTRVTEYATALSHAHRLELPQGSLGEYIAASKGGLKELVATERRLRRAEAGKADRGVDGPRKALAKKLRAMPPVDFSSIGTAGSEFALVMIHRSEAGGLTLLGEVPDDPSLVERAARRLIG